MQEKTLRWLELVGGFIALPVLIGWCVPPKGWIPLLWLIALFCEWRLRRDPGAVLPVEKKERPESVLLRRMLIRFALITVVFAAVVYFAWPARFLNFPRQRPLIWLMVVFLYPLLSVYPQELVYRRFFFRRFAKLCASPWQLSLASALTFSWMHLILRNPVALGLTFIGGWFFAETYRLSGSLRLACLEHSLYGTLVFTAGLGEYIYHGAVH